jgi:hypothetical protein
VKRTSMSAINACLARSEIFIFGIAVVCGKKISKQWL